MRLLLSLLIIFYTSNLYAEITKSSIDYQVKEPNITITIKGQFIGNPSDKDKQLSEALIKIAKEISVIPDVPITEPLSSFGFEDPKAIALLPEHFFPANWSLYQKINTSPKMADSDKITQNMQYYPTFRISFVPGAVYNVLDKKPISTDLKPVTIAIGPNGLPDEAYYSNYEFQGPWPVPNNLLIQDQSYWNIPPEGPWVYVGSPTGEKLLTSQRGVGDISDRHALVYSPQENMLYEWYKMYLVGDKWYAGYNVRWDLTKLPLEQREQDNSWHGRNSADAAGLPILPLMLRKDEIVNDKINHAIRCTLPKNITQEAFTGEALHRVYTGVTDPLYPRMGDRLRLKSSYVLKSSAPKNVAVVVKALKEYGLIVADIGGPNIGVAVCPDVDFVEQQTWLWELMATDFEIVDY